MKDTSRIASAKCFVAFCALTVVAFAGSDSTISQPERHPVRFAFLVSWAIIIVAAAITRDALVKMDPRRFRFVHWEHEGRVYERFGVQGLAWVLRRTPLGWLNPRIRLASQQSGIDSLLREMNYAEGAHLVGGAVTFGIAIFYTAAGAFAVAVSFLVMTILFHVYPVMLQRRNRGRVLRLVRRLSERSASVQPSSAGLAVERIDGSSE